MRATEWERISGQTHRRARPLYVSRLLCPTRNVMTGAMGVSPIEAPLCYTRCNCPPINCQCTSDPLLRIFQSYWQLELIIHEWNGPRERETVCRCFPLLPGEDLSPADKTWSRTPTSTSKRQTHPRLHTVAEVALLYTARLAFSIEIRPVIKVVRNSKLRYNWIVTVANFKNHKRQRSLWKFSEKLWSEVQWL